MLQRAGLALRMQQFVEAERLAAEVLKASRTNAAAISILAQALIAQRRGEEAIAPLEKAVRRSDDPGLETLLAGALSEAGRAEEAVERLRRTTERRPPFLPAFQELAGQLAMAARIAEAIAVIDGAIGLAPGVVELRLDMSRLHLYGNDRRKARAVLTEAREIAPGRSDVYTALGRLLFLDGEYQAATDTFRHALALNPDDAMTRADLAACLFEMGERTAAEACLRLAYGGRNHMLGRTSRALVGTSRGRFFLRPSALTKFLQSKPA